MTFITVPFSWVLNLLYDTFHNYGVAILLFGVIVKLILMPFQIKSKSSMMRTNLFAPQMQELQKKYASNQQRYQEEVSKLYKREKVNPMSGCIWTLIPFPFLIALYSIVRQPLRRLMSLSDEQVTLVTDKLVELGKYIAPEKVGGFEELTIANLVHENYDAVQAVVAQVKDIDFGFLGLNLSHQPDYRLWAFDWSNPVVWGPALGLFFIPILSALLSFVTMRLSQRNNPAAAANPATAGTNKTMMLMGPFMSLFIGFGFPAAMGVYWIAQSALTCVEELSIGRYFRKKMAVEQAAFQARERVRNEEIERKHQETERLKAEGKTQQNTSTSKKKLQTKQRSEDEERRAAAERIERAARRAKHGIIEPEAPASQVGNRRYARGRAFVEDRFENPELAEEATTAALEESEAYAAEHGEEYPLAVESESADDEESLSEDEDARDAYDEEDEEL